MLNPNDWPKDSTKRRIWGISALFQFMALVLKQNGRPLDRNSSMPFMNCRNDPETCVKRSKASSLTEWQEMSIENGGACFSRSMIARVKRVPFV